LNLLLQLGGLLFQVFFSLVLAPHSDPSCSMS
jgi:hypothetical protein